MLVRNLGFLVYWMAETALVYAQQHGGDHDLTLILGFGVLVMQRLVASVFLALSETYTIWAENGPLDNLSH